jgi:hypothetical protein
VPTQAGYARQQAAVDRELARRQLDRLDRFTGRNDLSPAARDLAAAERAALEKQITDLDATLAGPRRPFAAAVLDPSAEKRLRQAGANLSETRAELLSDHRRSNLAAQHRAQQLAETARIREWAELNAVPEEELREACPSYFADLPMVEG